MNPRNYGLFRASRLAMAVALATSAAPSPADSVRHDTEHEQPLLRILSEIQGLDLDSATNLAESLVRKNPEFRLAQLVYADLLMAKAQTPVALGAEGAADGVPELLAEARARWRHGLLEHGPELLPDVLIELPADQPTALVVDTGASRLYVFENRQGTPVLTGDYYVSIGKNGIEKRVEGDKKTPLGVYYVTEHLPGASLPPYYGIGAFPLNYPNEWDRHLGNTGSGIWLHGNPLNSYSRPPQASDGCVTLSNEDFKELQPFIRIGKTPVVIAPKVGWVTPDEIQKSREELNLQIRHWAKDWSSRDVDRYLAHYADDFFSPDKNYAQWRDYKRLVTGQKSFIDVKVDQVGIVAYPEHQPLMMVEFDQDYRSDNLSVRSPKRQWWRKERDGRWRIVYEGPA